VGGGTCRRSWCCASTPWWLRPSSPTTSRSCLEPVHDTERQAAAYRHSRRTHGREGAQGQLAAAATRVDAGSNEPTRPRADTISASGRASTQKQASSSTGDARDDEVGGLLSLVSKADAARRGHRQLLATCADDGVSAREGRPRDLAKLTVGEQQQLLLVTVFKCAQGAPAESGGTRRCAAARNRGCAQTLSGLPQGRSRPNGTHEGARSASSEEGTRPQHPRLGPAAPTDPCLPTRICRPFHRRSTHTGGCRTRPSASAPPPFHHDAPCCLTPSPGIDVLTATTARVYSRTLN
jgi:hypothetical protein